MRFTGLSEFLWFLLLFGALFAFTVWRQQRDRRRRQERMARMAREEFPPEPVPEARAPEVRASEAPLPEAPDIAWGRGAEPVAPPPEIPPGWTEVPPQPPPPRMPLRPPPPSMPVRPPALSMPARRRAAPPMRARRRMTVDLHSAAGLQHAIVALTVLGPCRALEPWREPLPPQEPGERTPAPGAAAR